MVKEDLRPFDKIPKVDHKMISRRGGKSRSIRKSESAKWRHLKLRIKNGKMKVSDPAWLIERIENSKAMAADILNYLDEVKEDVHKSQRVALSNTYKDMLKTVHGEKIKVESTNTNLNINTDLTDYLDKLYDKRMDDD